VTVVATSNINEGVLVASQAAGFGAGLHNTVMIGLPSPGWGDGDYTKTLKNLMFINRNIILFQKGKIPWTENRGRIQVWWGGQETNVRLMLLLAYLLQNNCDDHRPISLATIVPDQEHEATARKRLEETFSELRIAGETRIIINPDSRPIPDIIRDQSAEASLVFLGMAKVNDENSKGYLDQLRKVAGPLGATMFVMHNILDLDYV